MDRLVSILTVESYSLHKSYCYKNSRIFNLQVHWKVLQSYFSACGRYNICGVLCGLSVFCAALILWSLWLSDWADDSLLPDPLANLIHRILGFAGFTMIISK